MLSYCGRGRLRLESVDLNALLEGVGVEQQPKLPAGSQMTWELAADLPPVEVDASRIRQVLTHVIENAVEALLPTGGSIVVATTVRDLAAAELDGLPWQETPRAGRYVSVQVSDDGCGMDEHTLARVFDPFFTTKSDNRGFGLAVTSGLLRAHKGSVTADSRPGGGTTVCILLPIGERSSESPSIDAGFSPRPGRRRPRATG